MIDEYVEKENKPYSSYHDIWTNWLFQYNDELQIVEAIESDYLMWNSEQHRLTPKYKLFCSLPPLVIHYHVTYVDDDNKSFKINSQHCNDF